MVNFVWYDLPKIFKNKAHSNNLEGMREFATV
jgi:hypothetical protein